MELIRRVGLVCLWVVLSALLSALYGIINDQITVTLSPEYFSVFKQRQFQPILIETGLQDAPTRIQAILVGTLATWWFGVLLGIVLRSVGVISARPCLRTRDFLRAVAGIMLFTLALSAIAGFIGWLVEPAVRPTVADWPFLDGIRNVRAAFAIGWWHTAAYLGGLIGTLAACCWAAFRHVSSTHLRSGGQEAR